MLKFAWGIAQAVAWNLLTAVIAVAMVPVALPVVTFKMLRRKLRES